MCEVANEEGWRRGPSLGTLNERGVENGCCGHLTEEAKGRGREAPKGRGEEGGVGRAVATEAAKMARWEGGDG